MNVNAASRQANQQKEREPLKIVHLNERAISSTESQLNIIDLEEEYHSLMKEPWVKYGTKLRATRNQGVV
jgi:N-acetyl-gamma-glutamyl-phosphate reductase/acetylglutamate kinase